MDYRSIGAEKRRSRQSKIPEEWLLPTETYRDLTNVMEVPLTCGILSQSECDITSNYDATAILTQIKEGNWSAESVTIAFCKRAAIAQQLTKCLTEIFFDDAIKRASQLDRERRENPGVPLRPLHGLPVSLKDSFQVIGLDTSTGLGCFVNEPAQENSGMAALLLDLGAILYCKTNLPQIIMTGDSDNNIFGRTVNPRNVHLTAGGSTGGEGALLALRGSVLGVGTDIAGSIRVPSVCNGIYGFRPSVGIVPHGGVRDLMTPGTDGVRSTAGPMAASFRDIALFMKTVMGAETWKYDSTVISLPWTEKPPKSKVRIGLALDDGMFTPTPPVRRGLQKAAELLSKSRSVDLVSITLPNNSEHYADLVQFMTLSGNKPYLDLLARTGEPIVPSLQAVGLLNIPRTDLSGLFELNVRRQAAAQKYLKLFLENEIDAILMPPAAHTALPHDKWTQASYTGLWNYLDYPAIVIPVDEVSDSDAVDDPSHAKYGDQDVGLYSLYTGPQQYKGVPIGVQIVGYRHADEALLQVANLIDSIVNC